MGGFNSHRLRDDGGFGITEVLVAAVILFMVLTAVLGLVAQTTMMGLESQGLSAVSNAINSYVERVRALPFPQVATGPLGKVAEETTTVAGFEVNIRPTVRRGANPSLKNLVLAITVERPGGRPGPATQSYEITVLIRDRDVAYSQNDAPKVKFIAPTPATSTVIEGGLWYNAAGSTNEQARFSVQVDAYDGRAIQSVELWCDGVLMKDAEGHPARWTVGDGIAQGQESWTLFPPFVWDSAQDGGVLQDGQCAVEVVAVDNASLGGAVGRAQTMVKLDNTAPKFYHLLPYYELGVWPYAGNSRSSGWAWTQSLLASFEKAFDGNELAESYDVHIWRSKTATEYAGDGEYWLELPMRQIVDATSLYHNSGTMWCQWSPEEIPELEGFHRYRMQVFARSYAPGGGLYDHVSFDSLETTQAGYTSPRITGTYTTTSSTDASGTTTYTTSLSDVRVQAPLFPTTGTASFAWHLWGSDVGASYASTTKSNWKVQTGTGSNLLGTGSPVVFTHGGCWAITCDVSFTPADPGYGGQQRLTIRALPVGWSAFQVVNSQYVFIPQAVGTGVVSRADPGGQYNSEQWPNPLVNR